MEARLENVLREHADEIAATWARRAQEAFDPYARVPRERLEAGARRIIEGIIAAIRDEDYSALYQRLAETAEERAAFGIDVSEMGRALLMGCEAVLPILQRQFSDDAQQLVWSVTRIERVMHRSRDLLDQAFRDTDVARETSVLRASTRRLEHVLRALGHDCAVVDREMRVLWRAPVGGALADVVEGQPYPSAGKRAASHALLTQALESRQSMVADPALEDGLERVIVTASEDGGDATEAIALYRAEG